jgi:ribonuclease HI
LQQVTGWADYTDETSPEKILALSRG